MKKEKVKILKEKYAGSFTGKRRTPGMTDNLTEKEIKTVNTGVLNSRFCCLVEKGETLPANEITVADAWEILQIEDELRRRVIKAVGHDFYPSPVQNDPTS